MFRKTIDELEKDTREKQVIDLPEFATSFKTKLPENMIYIIFSEALS